MEVIRPARCPAVAASGLQRIVGPQGATLLFDGLFVVQSCRQSGKVTDITEIAAYLLELAEAFGGMTLADFRHKPGGAVASRQIGGRHGERWCAWVLDEGEGCVWGFGAHKNRIHHVARPAATMEEGQRAALTMAHGVATEARAILRGMEGDPALPSTSRAIGACGQALRHRRAPVPGADGGAQLPPAELADVRERLSKEKE